jgi:hypothetical protein
MHAGILCAGKEPSLCQKHGTRHPASYDEPRLAMPVFSGKWRFIFRNCFSYR